MKQRWLLYIAIVLVIGLVVVAGVYFLSLRSIRSDLIARTSAKERKYFDSLTPAAITSTAASLDYIDSLWPQIKPGNSADAGPYLNPLIARRFRVYEDISEKFSKWQRPWPKISPETEEILYSFDPTNPMLESDLEAAPMPTDPGVVNYVSIDPSWLNEIQKYDYWDLHIDGPLKWQSETDYSFYGWAKANDSLDVIGDYITLSLIKQFYRDRSAGNLDEFQRKIFKFVQLAISTEDLFMLAWADRSIRTATELLKSEGIHLNDILLKDIHGKYQGLFGGVKNVV